MQKQESFRSIWALENSELFFTYANEFTSTVNKNNAELSCAFTLLGKMTLALVK